MPYHNEATGEETEAIYVFETDLPNGGVTQGTAGLSFSDMNILKEFYRGTRVVRAAQNTPLLKIVQPVARPSKE